MIIATGSVNGIGADRAGGPRLELRRWLRERRPDIVALQKVRVWDREFPASALDQLGYRSWVHGKAFGHDYGVAVLTRKGLPEPTSVCRGLPGAEGDGARFLAVDVGGFTFASIYAPYGAKPGVAAVEQSVAAVERRVAWLESLRSLVNTAGYASKRTVLAGDFNVKTDVALSCKGYYTCREQRALAKLCALGFEDLYRRVRPDGDGFTFGFNGADNGRSKGTSRLHLILGSNIVANDVRYAWVDGEFRLWSKAAPVVVELDPGF